MKRLSTIPAFYLAIAMLSAISCHGITYFSDSPESIAAPIIATDSYRFRPYRPSSNELLSYIPENSAEGMPRKLVRHIKPDWPKALGSYVHATRVLARVIINDAGDVINVKIEHSPDTRFNEPTIKAIMLWKYEPIVVLPGEPELSTASVLITYHIY